MTFINTDGLPFLGPGSEWFWSAVSAVAVVVTLVAIYRQLVVQRSAKEVQEFDEVWREWNSERFIRLRYFIATALRDAGELERAAAPLKIGDWWDSLAGQIRAGSVSRSHILRMFSHSIVVYWTMLRHLGEAEWDNFAWLIDQVQRDGTDYTRELTPLSPEGIAAWIRMLEEELTLEEALRGNAPSE